ncbi:MAG: aminopeptidase P family protein [Myxococcota bacterium]|nr:aminopeptidase P family protein [Myxococcota bacterium]
MSLSPDIHRQRRATLMAAVSAPVLLSGNGLRFRNSAYPLPFRQDSTFLYYTGCRQPDAAVLLADGQSTLFLTPPADDDALWHGHSASITQAAEALGFDRVRPRGELAAVCERHGALRTIAVPDSGVNDTLSQLTGQPVAFRSAPGNEALIAAIITQRRLLGVEEVAQMQQAAKATNAGHRAAMAVTRPGGHEREVAAVFNAMVASHGCVPAYGAIVTVRGEILHNEHYVNPLQDGQLLLLDGGAESPAGYATDVTRTWPVSGTFSGRQRAAYEAVLAAQEASIALVRPGVRYRDVHTASCRVLAQFLIDEGLLTGSVDAAVETGAHALFFPHGVGHLIGLDVHDMEGFGDRQAYPPHRSRSEQFGTGYLRLDLDLEEGMAVTIEPGFYIVPAILSDPVLTERFARQLELPKVREWFGFGGIRIEDDVLTTASEPLVITGDIPKTVAEIEAAMSEDFVWERFTR